MAIDVGSGVLEGVVFLSGSIMIAVVGFGVPVDVGDGDIVGAGESGIGVDVLAGNGVGR